MPAGEEGSMTAAPILSHIQYKKLLLFKIFIYFMFIVSQDCIDYCFMHIKYDKITLNTMQSIGLFTLMTQIDSFVLPSSVV